MVLLRNFGSRSIDTVDGREELEIMIKAFLLDNDRTFLSNFRKAKKYAKNPTQGEEPYVDEMMRDLKEIVNSILKETPSIEFLKKSASGLKQFKSGYMKQIKEEKETDDVASVMGGASPTGKKKTIESTKTIVDEEKVMKILNRKKLIDLVENDNFVNDLQGITFTKYGRDLQDIKKFGKTYKQMFGKDWYNMDVQFDITTKKETYSIAPRKPLGKHVVITFPSESNIKIEKDLKDKKIKSDGVTNGIFRAENAGAFKAGQKEEINITLDIPELKGIKEKDQKHLTFRPVQKEGQGELLEPQNEEESTEIMEAFEKFQEENKDKIIDINYRFVENWDEVQEMKISEAEERRKKYNWTKLKKVSVSEEEYKGVIDDTALGAAEYSLLDDKRNDFIWRGKRYEIISFAGTKIKYFDENVLDFDEFFIPAITKWVEQSNIFEGAKKTLRDTNVVYQFKIELTIKSPPKNLSYDGEGLYNYLKDATLKMQVYNRKRYEFDFNPYLRQRGAKGVNEDFRDIISDFNNRYEKLKRLNIAGE